VLEVVHGFKLINCCVLSLTEFAGFVTASLALQFVVHINR